MRKKRAGAFAVSVVAALALYTRTASAAELDAQNIAGSWQCASPDGREAGSAVFDARPNALDFVFDYDAPSGIHYELRGEFDYNPSAQRWTLHERQTPDLSQFVGYAGAWRSQEWVFDGAIYPPNPGDSMFDNLEPARISFVAFNSNAFEMVRTQNVGGQWVTHDPWTADVLDESCSRLPPRQ